MTNSRCFRIDLKLNRFVTSTKCNSTKVLSAVSAHEEPTPPDCTTPRSQIGNAGAMPVQKAPGMNPEPHQSRSRCFQISPSRGLTPLTARDERVHPISMWVIVSHFQCSEPKTSRIYPKLLSRHKSLKALRAICTLPQTQCISRRTQNLTQPKQKFQNEIMKNIFYEKHFFEERGTNRKSRAMPQWIVVQ